VGAVEGYNLQVHNQDVHTKVVLKVGWMIYLPIGFRF
jgi:hypothetical protein